MNNLVEHSSMYKPSHYNILIPKEDALAIFNTNNGKMVKYIGKDAKCVKRFLEKEILEESDDDLFYNLKNNKFIVQYEYDEIELINQLEKSQNFGPYLDLIILTTEQCNFRCIYCYEKFNKGKMLLDTQEKIIEFVESNIDQYKGLNVGWFGGEPLEALDVIIQLSEAFIEVCHKKKKAYFAGITTNGYNLTLNVFKLLKKLHVTFFQITFDGIPIVHDKQRMLIDGSGTSKKIIQNLVDIQKNIKSRLVQIVIRTNCTQETIDSIEEFTSFLKNIFQDDDRFGIFWQIAEDYGYLREKSTKEKFCSYHNLLEVMKLYGRDFNNIVLKYSFTPNGSVCYALKKNSIVIGADGTIHKCTCDLDEELNDFGKIGEYIDKDKISKWLEVEISKTSKCYHCKRRPLCHNRACKKNQRCPINFLMFNDMLEMLAEDRKFCEIYNRGEK